MSSESSLHKIDMTINAIVESSIRRSSASYEEELSRNERAFARLRTALALDKQNLRAKDEQIERQTVMGHESDHRLLNDVQMVVSLLSMQARASKDPRVSVPLAAAADRIATIGRVHRRLHSFDGEQTLALKQYLQDICEDYSAMLICDESVQKVIAVNGMEIELPVDLGIPLGFIVNELITNAAKHGNGIIAVELESTMELRCALTVSNDGVPLPNEFNPSASRGMGMKIIQSLVTRIGGELRYGPGKDGQGACFTVEFPVVAIGGSETALR